MKYFSASRLKIDRAKKHINDLNEMIRAFAVDSYTLSIQRDAQFGYDCVQIDTTQSVPDDFAPVIGDALHNLRSSLDLAINEIVFNHFTIYDDYTVFPFRKTRDDLVAAIKGAKIYQASKEVCDFILNIVKPYKGGNDALWALHDLNILDKHRLLVPFMQVTAVNDIVAEDDRGAKIVIGTWAITRNRTATHECVGHANIKITNKGKATLMVLFDDGMPMEGCAVVETLIQFTELVSGVLDGIERVLIAEK